MNSDGSDLVDVNDQYNANWDQIDDEFIPIDVNSATPRPTKPTGLVLYENNSESELYSVGGGQWCSFASNGPGFSKQWQYAPAIARFADTEMPIGDATQNSKCFTSPDANTVRLELPGWYLVGAALRYVAAAASGMYLMAVTGRNLDGSFVSTWQQSELKGNENAPISLNLQTLIRVTTAQSKMNLTLITYQNSAASRFLENTAGDGSTYCNFQLAYLRPLI